MQKTDISKLHRDKPQPQLSRYVSQILKKKRGEEITPVIAETIDFENILLNLSRRSHESSSSIDKNACIYVDRVKLRKRKLSLDWCKEIGLKSKVLKYCRHALDPSTDQWPTPLLLKQSININKSKYFTEFDERELLPWNIIDETVSSAPVKYSCVVRDGELDWKRETAAISAEVHENSFRSVPVSLRNVVRSSMQLNILDQVINSESSIPIVDSIIIDNSESLSSREVKLEAIEQAISRHVEGVVDSVIGNVFEILNELASACADDRTPKENEGLEELEDDDSVEAGGSSRPAKSKSDKKHKLMGLVTGSKDPQRFFDQQKPSTEENIVLGLADSLYQNSFHWEHVLLSLQCLKADTTDNTISNECLERIYYRLSGMFGGVKHDKLSRKVPIIFDSNNSEL